VALSMASWISEKSVGTLMVAPKTVLRIKKTNSVFFMIFSFGLLLMFSL